MPGRLESEALPRRDFLGLAGMWTAAFAILGSVVGMIRLPKPSVLPEAGSRVPVGRPEELPAGTIRLVLEQKFLIVSEPSGVAAISMVCTHLGCIVSKKEEGFACPCHGSVFGPDGAVRGGPAPRGLRWLQVTQAVDGRLLVDVKREVKPGTFFRA